MSHVIGYIIWFFARAYTIVARKKSCTFTAPDGTPYMTRWPLWTRAPWPDAEGRTGGEGWYLHRMVASDWSRELHNHPAPSFACVVKGGYYEQRKDTFGATVRQIWRGPLSFNLLTHLDFHRVVLRTRRRTDWVPGTGLFVTRHVPRPSWSLFYIGPRTGKGWGFLQPDGTVQRAAHNDGNTGAKTDRAGTVQL